MADLARLIEPGRVLLIGEVHGTNEHPALVGSITAAAVAQLCPVTVALDLPAGEQTRIDTFLDSDGTPADRAALTAGPFWNRPTAFADGRSSRAIGMSDGGTSWAITDPRHSGRHCARASADWILRAEACDSW